MKDFTGMELEVGQTVVHGVGGRYGGLSGPYKVHSFTPKQVRICKEHLYNEEGYKTSVPPHNLVIVPDVPSQAP